MGPALAKRIVKAFGVDSLDIIETEPERLSVINGITPERARLIGEEYRRINSVREAITYLSKFEISPLAAVAVWRRYGDETVDFIRQNPYILCENGIDIEFSRADFIASEMGFDRENDNRVRAGIVYTLRENANAGHTCLPKIKLCECVCRLLGVEKGAFENALDTGLEFGELALYESPKREYVYLGEYYRAERYISAKIAVMIEYGSFPDVDFRMEIEGIEWSENIKYEEKQKKAIEECMKNRVFILTGGPGTGKTTTLNAVILLCKQRKMKISLAAPTGRAAKRMTDLTGSKAQTIHRLLEVDFTRNELAFKHNEQNPLDADVVIIDEMSMVDTLLMESLMRAIRPETKLIMVGDSNQLPSVGAGNVLKDLLEVGFIPSVELKEIFRQAAESLIVTNAHAIVSGKIPELDDRTNDFFFMPVFDENKVVKTVIDLYKTRLPSTYGFSPLEDIQILSPTRIGAVGTKELNKALQLAMNPPSRNKSEFKFYDVLFRTGDKIMQIKNDYDVEWIRGAEKGTGIFNGDMGVILEVSRQTESIKIDFEGRISIYTPEMLSKIEHAYAVTIHKSQGSEYDAVIIPLPNYIDKLMYRNLLYTAVTRAKKILILVGVKARVHEMVANHRRNLRYSCLKSMLAEAYNEAE